MLRQFNLADARNRDGKNECKKKISFHGIQIYLRTGSAPERSHTFSSHFRVFAIDETVALEDAAFPWYGYAYLYAYGQFSSATVPVKRLRAGDELS
jgi:hypothetical protein